METLQALGLKAGELADDVAVITGAGRGIGRAAAEALAWLGAKVVIAELSPAGAAAADSICRSGGTAQFIQTDVSEPESVVRLVEETRRLFGEASILVNNAILCPVASVLEMDPAEWDRVMAVNLRGAFLTSRGFLPGMLNQSRGVIVNMISTQAMPHLSAYIASKQGLAAFSQSLAGEVGEQGVQVIALAPGFVNTPGLQAAAKNLAPRLGFSEAGFLSMSLHPAYEGSMPVEDAAAAAAYLIARKAVEYHGEATNGFEILEEAGYLPQADPAEKRAEQREQAASAGGVGEQTHRLAQRLVGVLEETETEFERLPIFVRPMARAGFKGKAGLGIKEWKALLAKFAQTQSSTAPKLRELLPRLEKYYEGVPAETARFTKDAAFLEEVRQVSQERCGLIRQLWQDLEN